MKSWIVITTSHQNIVNNVAECARETSFKTLTGLSDSVLRKIISWEQNNEHVLLLFRGETQYQWMLSHMMKVTDYMFCGTKRKPCRIVRRCTLLHPSWRKNKTSVSPAASQPEWFPQTTCDDQLTVTSLDAGLSLTACSKPASTIHTLSGYLHYKNSYNELEPGSVSWWYWTILARHRESASSFSWGRL